MIQISLKLHAGGRCKGNKGSQDQEVIVNFSLQLFYGFCVQSKSFYFVKLWDKVYTISLSMCLGCDLGINSPASLSEKISWDRMNETDVQFTGECITLNVFFLKVQGKRKSV